MSEYELYDEDQDLIDVKVVWEISLRVPDVETAANRAQDILRSRMPLSLLVSCEDETTRIIPRAVECIEQTIRRFLPGCSVECDMDDEGIDVYITADHFRDMPHGDDREGFVASMFGSLPPEELEHIRFFCYTSEEWEAIVAGDEEEGEELEVSGAASACQELYASVLDRAAMDFVVDQLTPFYQWKVKEIKITNANNMARDKRPYRLVQVELSTVAGKNHRVVCRVDEDAGEVFEFNVDGGTAKTPRDLLACAYS